MPSKTENLHKTIVERIEQQDGSMTVAEYMEMALTAYYANKNPFGVEGDFITAPEVSQMFGEMIALWFVDIWMQLGMPKDVQVVELGPGRGTLSADMLRIMHNYPGLFQNLNWHLVEISPTLTALQKETLKGYNVTWHESFETVPEGTTFIVANELFDALPIHQFEKQNGVWHEKVVVHEGGNLAFALQPCDLEIEAPDGSIYEASPASVELVKQLADRVAKHGGAGLVVDYGYATGGFGDTLQAVSRHQYVDVLENPGEVDITAHVDFDTLGKSIKEQVHVSRIMTQGMFLQALGIALRAEKLAEEADAETKKEVMKGLERLISPKEMGELFKVLAFVNKDVTLQTVGFEI